MSTFRNRLATALLYLFAIGAPVSSGVGNIATGAFLIAAVLVVVLARQTTGLPPRSVVLLLGGFLVWNALATALAAPAHWDKFLEELWHKPMLLAVPLVAWGVPRSVDKAVKLMVLVGAVVTLYAVYQHFAGRDLVRNEPILAEGDRYLAYGFFDHHLTYGGHVMLLLVMAGALLLFQPTWRSVLAGLLLACVGLLGLALLWSYARSAQLGALFAALFLVAQLPRARRRWALLGIALAIACSIAIPSVRQRASKTLIPGREATRVNLWRSSVDGIRERPLVGWGRGNFGEMMNRHRVEGFYDTEAHSHNDFLMQAVNAGVIGLALYVGLLVVTGRALWRRRNHVGASTWLVLGGIAILVGLSAAGIFQVYQTDDEVEMVHYFLLGCGLALGVAPAGRSIAEVGGRAAIRTEDDRSQPDEQRNSGQTDH